MADVVVVGAGLAGARTCTLLRAAGVAGRIVLLGAEAEPPYDRPPLTKDPDAEVDLRPAMGVDVWAHADEVRLGVRAEGLVGSAGSRLSVRRSDGAVIDARAVVVATGASPVPPAGWDRAGVHVLHTRAEAGKFWAGVGPGVRLAVVGGGWIGCEAAATAASRGARVALLEASGTVLAGRVPAEVSERVAAWLVGAGVQIHLERPVSDIEDRGGALVVSGMGVDLVLAALGVRPSTGWLDGSGVRRAADGAVLVDPWGRSSLAGVFSVGDAAQRWSPRFGMHLSGGHWTDALNGPETVASAVGQWVGGEFAAESWGRSLSVPAADPIPYVFSDIGARRLLVLGAPAQGQVIWREADGVRVPGAEAWSAFSLDESGRLLGMCTSGRPRDLAAARRAMLGHPTGTPRSDPGALADPDATPASMFPGEG